MKLVENNIIKCGTINTKITADISPLSSILSWCSKFSTSSAAEELKINWTYSETYARVNCSGSLFWSSSVCKFWLSLSGAGFSSYTAMVVWLFCIGWSVLASVPWLYLSVCFWDCYHVVNQQRMDKLLKNLHVGQARRNWDWNWFSKVSSQTIEGISDQLPVIIMLQQIPPFHLPSCQAINHHHPSCPNY